MTEKIDSQSFGLEDQKISPGDPTYQVQMNKLAEDVEKLKNEFEKAHENYKKGQYDIITIMAVFVGLITYLGLEIQVFNRIYNPLLIIGISIFFIASILLFILTINIILKEASITWKNFFNPLMIILLILLALSIGCIALNK